ncbi:hypothetical protein [Sciscionella sediminilitoris]|uniref:hypothetical protein n=1 Tax=Sciscionella sediminilitoris TaxID=1445613 RepID=UPI0004DF9FD3|nr:hypothetical protein [Sciscionella sp. SE31]
MFQGLRTTQFCQWPHRSTPGNGEPDCHGSGDPDPGAVADSGGGGDYLSDESMHRANRKAIVDETVSMIPAVAG